MFGKWPLTTHTGWRKIANLEGLTDICATPGEAQRTVCLYTANGGQHIKRYVHGERPMDAGDIEFTGPKAFSVNQNCAVDTVAAAIELETVDGDEPEVLHAENSVFYGAGNNALHARYILAFFSSGIAGEIKTPARLDSSIAGVRADNKRLWVFTRAMIFCTTHSSVKDYLRRARKTAPAELDALRGPQWDCAKSGFGVLTHDKKFIKIDAAGNQQAKEFIAGLTKKSDIKVAVTGNVDGDQIAVSKIELQ